MLAKFTAKFFFHIAQRIAQDGTGTAFKRLVMHQERRNTERSHRKSVLGADIAIVVVYIPVYGFVRNDVHLGVSQVGNHRQRDAGAVCLHTVLQQLLHVLEKGPDRNFLIGVVTSHIDSHKGHKLHLGVLLQDSSDLAAVVTFRRNRKQHLINVKIQHVLPLFHLCESKSLGTSKLNVPKLNLSIFRLPQDSFSR